MFDTTQPIDLKVASPDSADGYKRVSVNFPTDAQLAEHSSKVKLIERNLGRGKSMTDSVPDNKASADLLAAIKVSGDELDDAEAGVIIYRLTRCEVTGSKHNGNRLSVTLKTPAGPTTHDLRVASASEVQDFVRSAYPPSINLPHNASEKRYNLAASGYLYDKLDPKPSGYLGNVPLTHKSAVIGEILNLQNQDGGDAEIEGF